MWACACDCGGYVELSSTQLKKGGKKTCGCGGRKELAGQRFGSLTVVRFSGYVCVGKSKNRVAEWLCKCDCGEELRLTGNRLTSGGVRQCSRCAALRREQNRSLRRQEKVAKQEEAARRKKEEEHLAYLLGEDDLALLKTGRRFGKLAVESVLWESRSAKCSCDCGKTTEVPATDLTWGRELSCGCETVEEIIYGVLTGDHVKIGVSKKFWHRMHALQTGSPFDVEVLCLLPKGTPKKEKEIHKMLKKHCSHGEWFRADLSIVSALCLSKDADDLVLRISLANGGCEQ
jgi:hypothetical protein